VLSSLPSARRSLFSFQIFPLRSPPPPQPLYGFHNGKETCVFVLAQLLRDTPDALLLTPYPSQAHCRNATLFFVTDCLPHTDLPRFLVVLLFL